MPVRSWLQAEFLSAYLEAIAPETTPLRKEELRKALVEYCALDTLGLVRVVEVMRGKG